MKEKNTALWRIAEEIKTIASQWEESNKTSQEIGLKIIDLGNLAFIAIEFSQWGNTRSILWTNLLIGLIILVVSYSMGFYISQFTSRKKKHA